MIILDESDVWSLAASLGDNYPFKVSPKLAEVCGADFMITPVDAGAVTERLIKRHVSAGADLYKFLNAIDLASSHVDTTVISKMKKVGARYSHANLLVCGLTGCDRDGCITVCMEDNKWINTNKLYVNAIMKTREWVENGGSWTNIPNHKSLMQFVLDLDDRIKFVKPEPSAEWYFAFKEIVGEKAQEVYDKMVAMGSDLNLSTAIAWVTDDRNPSVDEETIVRARAVLGLEKDFYFSVVYEGEEASKSE